MIHFDRLRANLLYNDYRKKLNDFFVTLHWLNFVCFPDDNDSILKSILISL